MRATTKTTMTRKMEKKLARLTEATFTVGDATFTSADAVAQALLGLGDTEVFVYVTGKCGEFTPRHAFKYTCSPKKVSEPQGLYLVY